MSGIATYNMLGRNGRTGNVLFQAAATIGYAGSTGKMYAFPFWDGAKYFKQFPIDKTLPNNSLDTIREDCFEYKEMPFVNGDINIDGYRQSKKYWEKFSGTVKSCFEFNDDLQLKCKSNLEKLQSRFCTICAIHFRFSDYIGNDFYHQLFEDYDYYLSATKTFNCFIGKDSSPLYVVFSDDKERAISSMKKITELHSLSFVFYEGENEYEDLCAMSMCDAVIMANSSFSWWAAYLGKKKQVIAPKDWFSESAGLNTKDLYCEGWKVI